MQSHTFLSTLSLRRATRRSVRHRLGLGISIHALLAESDRFLLPHGCLVPYFYPRSPCGERRAVNMRTPATPAFLSTLSLRRATVHAGVQLICSRYISIHALLAESDGNGVHLPALIAQTISIHALLAESDGEFAAAVFGSPIISIHALLAESDTGSYIGPEMEDAFLSTLSLRRATSCGGMGRHWQIFLSTLSLRRATLWLTATGST